MAPFPPLGEASLSHLRIKVTVGVSVHLPESWHPQEHWSDNSTAHGFLTTNKICKRAYLLWRPELF